MVIFTFTKNMSNEFEIFGITGFMQIIWAVIMFFIISEPQIYNEKEARRAGRKSFCGKVWSLMKLVYKACKQDKTLFIGIIASNITRN
jgi:hypothetical protein